MTEEQYQQAFVYMQRLSADRDLCERIAAKQARRGWTLEVIFNLTGVGAMGWADEWVRADTGHREHRGAVTFHYDSGIKMRWNKYGGRVIRWYCGHGRTLWRGWLLTPEVRRVYICEGEPDAISMLSEGLESGRTDELVVALSSAGTIPHNIAELMAGREVTIVGDRDAAGTKSAAKLTALLEGRVARLRLWKP